MYSLTLFVSGTQQTLNQESSEQCIEAVKRQDGECSELFYPSVLDQSLVRISLVLGYCSIRLGC